MAKQADVLIEVEGGVANCVRHPENVSVQIIDLDAKKVGDRYETWFEGDGVPCFKGGTWHNRDEHGKCTDCEN